MLYFVIIVIYIIYIIIHIYEYMVTIGSKEKKQRVGNKDFLSTANRICIKHEDLQGEMANYIEAIRLCVLGKAPLMDGDHGCTAL